MVLLLGTNKEEKTMTNMAITKTNFLHWASFTGVTIEQTYDPDFKETHFHAWAPGGKQFDASTCHNTNLGDYPKGAEPAWDWMIEEIKLTECETGAACDYCHPA